MPDTSKKPPVSAPELSTKPSAAGVETIRRLHGELAPYAPKLEVMRRDFRKQEWEFRCVVVEFLAGFTRADDTIEALWTKWQRQMEVRKEHPGTVQDLQRAREEYEAALAALVKTSKEQNTLRDSLREAVDAEAAGLEAALQEAVETIEAAVMKRLAKFLSEAEARAFMTDSDVVHAVQAARSTWMTRRHVADAEERGAYFLGAFKQLEASWEVFTQMLSKQEPISFSRA